MLRGDIEVCAIHYPGREMRSQEPSFRSLAELQEAIVPAMLPWLDKPFVFFGYSMGALISFELARTLTAETGLKPEHAFFVAASAPHLIEPRPIHELPDAEFLGELVKLNGIPQEVLDRADLIEYMLPILRTDFKVCETYKYSGGTPLQCPVTVFGGEQDPRVDRARLEAWALHSSMYFSSMLFPGDHFFIRTAERTLLRAVVRELEPLLQALPS